MYGLEAILPIEFEIPSLRLAIGERLDTTESLKNRLTKLEALNKSRQLASQHMEVTQRRRKVAFDKSNKVRVLKLSMWVMVQNARRLEFPAKFDVLWTGPYIIKEVFSNNSVQLKTIDGLDFPTRTNDGRCKEYMI